MTLQQLILQPLGLVTQPGKLVSLPPGAMSISENIYIRSPFKIERALAWKVATGDSPASGMRMWMLPSGSGPWSYAMVETPTTGLWTHTWFSPVLGGFYSSGTDFTCEDASSVFVPRDDGSVWAVEANSWQYVNMDAGVMCVERSADPTAGGVVMTSAGIRAPIGFFSVFPNALTVSGGALPWGYAAAYTAIVRRIGLNKAEYISAPCVSEFAYLNQGSAATAPSGNVIGTLYFDQRWVRVGDYLEIYRTRTQPHTLGAAYISLGSDYFRVTSIKLTSADITAGNVTFTDRTVDNALGDALYTNDGFQGTEGTTYPPPSAACMAQFKGYTFYGNVKQPASISLRPVNGWVAVNGASAGVVPSDNTFGSRAITVSQTSGNVTLTAANTANLAALVVGMYVTGPGIALSTITSIGASTFNITPAPTTTTGSNFVVVSDFIEINGTKCPATDPGVFAVYQSINVADKNMRVYGIEEYTPPMNPAFQDGVQSVALVTIRNEKLVGARSAMPTFTIRSSRGKLFDPPLPSVELGETAITISPSEQTDGWCCSEQHEPWRVPLANYERLGAGAQILALVPTKDALFFFTNKGVKRLSGSGGSAGDGFDWRMDPIDETLILCGPRTWCVLRDTVYARTSRGVVSITSDGLVTNLTEGVIANTLLGKVVAPGTAYTAATASAQWMVGDEANGEVILYEFVSSPLVFRYNLVTKTWVNDRVGSSLNQLHHGAYMPYDGVVCVLATQPAAAGFVFTPNLATTTYSASRIHFQPISGETPFQQKHWLSVDPLFVSPGAISVNVTVNGVVAYSSAALSGEGTINATRRSFDVPKDSPAISPAITVGFDVPASAVSFEFIGVAVQFVPISADRIVR